jgi:membrane protein YqaA with SNARE-associated domain
MQTALKILELWSFAFVTLALALMLLNLVWALIDYDLALHNLSQEIFIAAVASLAEGGSVAALIMLIPANYLPMATRALFIPAIVVGLIYKTTHYLDWSRYEIFLLLIFQLIIIGCSLCLLAGHFGAALAFFGVLIAVCCVIIAIGKSL